MGVDFRMQAVRSSVEGRLEPLVGDRADTPPAMHFLFRLSRGGCEFWIRLGFLEAIFHPGRLEGSPAELMRSLVPKDVSFRWFEDAYSGAYGPKPPPTADDCFQPGEVMRCLDAVRETMRDHADAFPPRYMLRDERTGEERSGLRAVFENRVYAIRCDWGRCDATPIDALAHVPFPKGDRRIDLREVRSIRCRQIGLGGIAIGRVGEMLGPEMSFLVEKRSILEVYEPVLDAMRSVASQADSRGAMVFTFLS